MGFTIIPNQPINLLPPSADPCNIGDGKEYNMLANIGDTLYLQVGQESCGENLLCEPTFENENFNIVNETFTGSATGWTLGAGWSYSSDGIVCVAGTTNTVEQGSLVFLAGYTYRIIINIEGAYSGYIEPSIGANTYGYSFRTLFHITPAANESTLTITPSVDFDGKIESVYVSVFSTSCWDYDSSWSLTDCGLTHTPGTATSVTQDFYRNEGFIKTVITVSNMTNGYLSVLRTNLGSTPYMVISSNGTYEINNSGLVTTPDTETLTLSPSSDFDGCISESGVYDLIGWNLDGVFRKVEYDSNGTPTYTTIGTLLSYVHFVSETGGVTFEIPTTGLDAGCYQVCLLDPCPHMITDTMSEEMSPDVGLDDQGSWTNFNFVNSSVLVTGGKMVHEVLTTNAAGGGIAASFAWPFINGIYQIDWSLTTGRFDTYDGLGFSNWISFNPPTLFGSYEYTLVSDPLPNTTYSGSLFISVANTGIYADKFVIGIVLAGAASGDINEITSASFIMRNAYNAASGEEDYTYCSNLISIETDHNCTKLIAADFEDDASALGFNFNSNFKLQQRLRMLKFNPFYPTESTDYEYSSGNRSKTFAKREKYYDILMDYMGETEHDTISAQILCDRFLIDGVEHFVKGDDYKPEWEKEGRQRLAQGRMAARLKSPTIYRNNK